VTELQQRIAASNLSAVSFDLGVSVAAVKKHLNRHMNRI
jgi:predicted ArsR family transcriptional regulator